MLQNKQIVPLLFLYHMIWMVIAYLFINHDGGDATRYWWIGVETKDVSWLEMIQPGTNLIKTVTFPLVKIFHLPFLFGFFLFSLWSFLGWYLLLKFFQDIHFNNRVLEILAIIFLFSPNQHFWTALIGKESLLWSPIVVLIINVLSDKPHRIYMLLSFLLIFLIRPHVGVIIGFGMGFYFLLKFKGILLKRIFIIVGTVLLMVASVYLLDQIMLGNGTVLEKIQGYYNAYNRVLRHTNAYVPLEDYNLFFKIWTFYCRPFLFEGSGWLYRLVGIENSVFLLCYMILVVMYFRFKIYLKLKLIYIVLFGIGFGLTLMYVHAYANFGLILRTKILILPFFILPLFKGFKE